MKKFLNALATQIYLETPYQENKFLVARTVGDVLEKTVKGWTPKKSKSFMKKSGYPY